MGRAFLSLVSLVGAYLRRCFAASGLSSQTLAVDDETTFHFWGPDGDDPDRRKPALVLLHGFGPLAIWQWRRQVQFFSPRFRVYVPDLLFFGGSTTSSADRTEVFQALALGKLLDRLGIHEYYVMGTSYGGFVAYHMARMWPEKALKVVIASSGVNMRLRDNDALLQRAGLDATEDLILPHTPAQLRTLFSLAICNNSYVSPNLLPDFLFHDFITNQYSDNRKEKTELLMGLTLGRDDKPNVSPLKQEVLIIWGEKDGIFPVEMAMELKTLLGEKAKLEVIENTSHVPQIEDTPRFNSIVKTFLCGSS